MPDPKFLSVLIFAVAWGLIGYTYVGFPCLLAVWVRLKQRTAGRGTKQPHMTEPLPRIAMVVAAFNEEQVVQAKLRNTWQLDYPADRFELIVGSDGSTDATAELLRACTDTRLHAYCFEERRGKISVLNDLVTRTEADILVFSDANTLFEPDALRKLVTPFQEPQVGCVSGELTLEQEGGVSGEGLYWKYEGWIKRNESALGFLIGCNGGIFALRRHLYCPLPTSTVVEDFVLSMRVLEQRYQVRFEPAARAVEPACASARDEMIRKVRIGAGNFQALGLTCRLLLPSFGNVAFAYWGHKVLRWLVPFFFLAAAGANLMLLDHEFFQLTAVAQLAGALVAARSYAAVPGRELPRWTRPVSYFYLMNYALFCGFLRFLFRTQRVTWERVSR